MARGHAECYAEQRNLLIMKINKGDLFFEVLIHTIAVLTAPIWGPFHLYSNFRYSLAIRRKIRGGALVAWNRLTEMWEHSGCYYGSLPGPDLTTRRQNGAAEPFTKQYPDSIDIISASLTCKNPYVSAYSFRAFWRWHEVHQIKFDPLTIPKELLQRKDVIQVQFGCIVSEVKLGKEVSANLQPTGRGLSF